MTKLNTHHHKKRPNFSPWNRNRPEYSGAFLICLNGFKEKFHHYIYANMDLDIDTKRAALKVSASIVGLRSVSGNKLLFAGSGTIIECEDVNGTCVSTILTSASLVRSSAESADVPNDIKIKAYLANGKRVEGQLFAYDFHYNIAAIKITTDTPLSPAILKLLDDAASIDLTEIRSPGYMPRPYTGLFTICPGDPVIALGRSSRKPYELMAAPGKFSLDGCNGDCNFDCMELFSTNCQISLCGTGGPLVNQHGEVIGLNFYDTYYTPFLPINTVAKCLEYFKRDENFNRPWTGLELANLYAARIGVLDKVIRTFPRISNGVLVEKVIQGSPADAAGILCTDVIVQCCGHPIRSLLEFYGMILDKVGESVEMIVMRTSSGEPLKMRLDVQDTSLHKINRWPIPKKQRKYRERLRPVEGVKFERRVLT